MKENDCPPDRDVLLASAYDAFFEEAPLPVHFSDAGSGIFGSWQQDPDGLPRYEYTLDHLRDPRAEYRTSMGKSREHWHAVANDRITALAHNEGYVEVLNWDRCGKYLNHWDPEQRQFAGGYNYIHSDGRTWNTLWSGLPEGAVQRRFFGMGYFEKHTHHDGLSLVERVDAPPGDLPALLCVNRIENESDRPREMVLVQYWGVNLHVLLPFPVMTHGLGRMARWWRQRFNRRFFQEAHYDEASRTLWLEWQLKKPEKAPPRDRATWGDFYPDAAFLSVLDDSAPCVHATDSVAFFERVPGSAPPGISGAADGTLVRNRCAGQCGAMLAFRRTVSLEPGERRTFRYLYGYARPGQVLSTLSTARKEVPPATPRIQLEFSSPEAPWLGRELAWHAYYLQANTLRQESVDQFVVDQGSAYSYLHGASGAHRDFALFALPLSCLRPDLARDLLRFSMRSQDVRTGALPYAHIGFGKQSGAGVHASSSDLDLFFLWAAAEYLGITRDFSLLEEKIPFHPESAGRVGTGLEHLQAALHHLVRRVGLGRHGLLRCGTGDWNDALVAFSRRKITTIRRGESLLNAGLAALALPALADIVETCAPEFAGELRRVAGEQARAARPLWNGRWWARGYTGAGDKKLGDDRLFLDCQAFPTLAGLLNQEERRCLVDAVQKCCINGEPAGASALWPPMHGWLLEPGADTNGGVWATVDAWTAWMLAEENPRQGWDFFLRTTLKQRAEAYPHVWHGIWSGPDACNAHYHPRPGESFLHALTPMTDFPIMNANRHAGPLLDILKLSGIAPRGNAVRVDPKLPFDHFVLRTPLIGIAYRPRGCKGYYRPVADAAFTFEIKAPACGGDMPPPLHVNIGGIVVPPEEHAYRFAVQARAGEKIQWQTD